MKRLAHVLGGLACIAAGIVLVLSRRPEYPGLLVIGFWLITACPSPNPPR